jgi:hypothetical protein
MRKEKDQMWVVYSIPVKNGAEPMRAVCELHEWEAMEREKPGFYTLIQSGIVNEGEAERLARGSSGEVRPRTQKHATKGWPGEATGATVANDQPGEV